MPRPDAVNAGGDDGYRNRLWKVELGKLAVRVSLAVARINGGRASL